jgi:hypothetical protein
MRRSWSHVALDAHGQRLQRVHSVLRAVSPDLQDFPLGMTVGALRQKGVTHVTVNCGLRWVADAHGAARPVCQTPEFARHGDALEARVGLTNLPSR